MKTTLTVADVSDDVKSSVRAYLLARVFAETEREKIDAMQREILETATYETSPEWARRGMKDAPERITDPKHAYLMTDVDFEDYYAECQHRIRKMGYKLPEGHCPALVAESLQVTTENLLIRAAAEMMGEYPEDFPHGLLCLGLEKRQEFIDLVVGLVINLPDFRNPLTGKLEAKTQ